jgi:Peptidase family M28
MIKKIFLPISIIIILFSFSSCSKEKEHETSYKPLYELDPYAKIPEFDAGYAFTQIEKQVSFGPRNPNSKGHQEALNYLQNELSKYADEVKLQSFSYPGYNGETLALTNIIAKFNPAKKHRIILCAHWDTRPRAEEDKNPQKQNMPILGANDGGSGVGVLLEIAKLLKSNQITYGIDIALFDGEDYGKSGDLENYSLGAKYFSANLPDNFQPAFAVLLDMIGDKDAYFPIEGNSRLYAPDVEAMIWNIAGQLQADKFENKESEPIYDDHISLNSAGIRTVDIIDAELIGADTPVERRNYWHTQKDDMKNIGKDTLQQVGKVLDYLIWSIRFNDV